ncbi:ABC transporter ATP-binding protein [Christensenellaceae bacterium OttesenSCG-928-K19]|nr:ABC transporter ATP-binding protein [Christensenellaceae bacterium OttesenSCG-928-K19]
MDATYAVEMKSISKYFGGFCALDNVDLCVQKGEIHAILGENGAGKTTLMNILYGFYEADSGEVWTNGQKREIKTPKDAISLGIGMVHQHFMLVETYTVLQNIILGDEHIKGPGVIDYKKAKAEIKKLAEDYHFNIDLDAKIQDITVGMQQRVEIIKALYRGADILILDEPTSVLTPQEIEELIDIMHNMVQNVKTIIIITHKLAEIMKSADTCTVIRRGKNIDKVAVANTCEKDLAELMVGRAVEFTVEKQECRRGSALLQIDGLVVEDDRKIKKVDGLSLELFEGEILGIAGVDGNGQKELFEAVTSLRKAKSGSIRIDGQDIQNTSPRKTFEAGISVIPEDRQKSGLVLDFTIAENMVLEKVQNAPFSKHGILDWKVIRQNADKLTKEYDVRPDGSAGMRAGALSGGNQQKAIIAREISNDGRVLVAVQPTRGLDVGAIEFVHNAILSERDKGKGVLLISLELDEVLKLSDRVAVIYNGRIVNIIDAKDADEKRIGLLMAGGEGA